MSLQDVFFARQSIVDHSSSVVGYELFFRPNTGEDVRDVDPSVASSDVILSALLELDPSRLLGDRATLINVPDGLLRSPIGLDQVLPPGQAVIQLLRDTQIDADTVTLAQLFRAAGYRIAIDWFDAGPKAELLLPYADIIKLNIAAGDPHSVSRSIEQLRHPGRTILTTHIETHDQFSACRKAGADWFQGFYLRKPLLERRKRPAGNRLSMMRVLGVVQDPEANIKAIEEAVRSDVGLSYRLLKLVNSASFSLPTQVTSIRHAVALLGRRRVRQWATLAMLAGIGQTSNELYDIAVIRA